MVAHRTSLLRWSLRDLRARWLQVAAIALVIGIGTGTAAGLSSISQWRRDSQDASYAALRMYDLKLTLTEGSFVRAARLTRAVETATRAGDLTAVEPRLVTSTQIDASHGGTAVLARARLIGVDTTTGPVIGKLHAVEGRVLEPGDAGRPVLAIDDHFAEEYGLPSRGTVRLGGGVEARYVGRVLQPEHFLIIGEGGDLFAARSLAVTFAPLDWVQRYAERPGQANELVVTTPDRAARARVERALAQVMRTEFPNAGFEITRQEDDPTLDLLYDDIEGDQAFYNIFATLILFGAAFAAFNLAGRVVEAQRREIGISMALGVSPRRIAFRPLLMGAEIAVIGVVFGIGFGYLMDEAMKGLLDQFLPLPVWVTDFQYGEFARGALLGFVLPVLAAAYPVWRAVRVTPIEAIQTSHRTASSGLAPLVRRLPMPGSQLAAMPVRNVLRTPRRTLFTALGIAAALTTLVGVVGMIDSFLLTVDKADAEIIGTQPDRLDIAFDFFYPVDAAPVRAVTGSPLLQDSEPQLQLGGTLLDQHGNDDIDVLVTFLDFASPIWRPTAVDGRLDASQPGIVLAVKAARDLGVDVGDTVAWRHPVRKGLSYSLETTRLPVVAIHPNPYRFTAYMDARYASIPDLTGIVNRIASLPAPGASVEEIQRALFDVDGIASVQTVATSAESIRDRIDESIGIFRVIEFAILLLALLIAFNSSSINTDERRREHATMFAFGVRPRSVLAVTAFESVLIGIIGTALGLLFGRILLEWLMRGLIPQTLPEVELEATLSSRTVATALALGIVAVTVAPLLTYRKLRRMDVPSTLRVVE